MPKNQKPDPENEEKENVSNQAEKNENVSERAEPAAPESEKSYYYDDAHGYEDYMPEDEEGDEKGIDSGLRSRV